MRWETRVVARHLQHIGAPAARWSSVEFLPVLWLRIPLPTRATVLRTYLEPKQMTRRPTLRVPTPRPTITSESDGRSHNREAMRPKQKIEERKSNQRATRGDVHCCLSTCIMQDCIARWHVHTYAEPGQSTGIIGYGA